LTEIAFGLDLGGSALKYGLVTRAGKILASGVVPNDARRQMPGIRSALREGVARLRDLARQHRVVASVLGCGCAGTLIGEGGKLVTPSPNLPFMKGFAIAAFLQKEARIPAVAENDASVAALAEFRVGAGKGADSLLMATVGTGIGGGLVMNGALVRGRFGTAGEIGHGVFQPDGLECGCGSRGCLEQYAASKALLRFHDEESSGRGPTAAAGALRVRDVIQLARAGERPALAAVARIGRNLGIGLTTCASLVPVDVIVIGGGISVLGSLLLRPVRAAFDAHALPYVRKGVKIVRAKLGNEAGFTGAALLAFETLASAKGRIRRKQTG
jgi:glucokinase